ncbi:MAG: hypothetical protein OHK0015_26250 [Chloroflexi bacterium OHK40]
MTMSPEEPERAPQRWRLRIPRPPHRYLRGYAFDPSLSAQVDTVEINEVMFKVPWERLEPGPVGEYLEVVDVDPASRRCYEPVALDDPLVLAQDGLPPSEGSPQFHQQYVYTVAMTTIHNFERALGRRATWRPRFVRAVTSDGYTYTREEPVARLRIYPHALRSSNAYYSPEKVALLFGYFPASSLNAGTQLPGGTIFSCLSHDIITHETAHALLDGVHRRLIEPTNPDVRAFHEAFADIVALMQHFTFPEVLRHQIARTRGDLAQQNLLGELAQQFGQATGRNGALRSAIGYRNPQTGAWEPLPLDPGAYQREFTPHKRGAILVAAVFDAFLTIYRRRVEDLIRIASDGTGVLRGGALHPDLTNRLADEAARAAQHVLNACIRAIDYMLPIDTTFGDFLRALITADFDLVPEDSFEYRVAFVEAFRRRGIYPQGVRSLSVESVRWPIVDPAAFRIFEPIIDPLLKSFAHEASYQTDRMEAARKTEVTRGQLHNFIKEALSDPKYRALIRDLDASELTGLALTRENRAFEARPELLEEFNLDKSGNPRFEVHALWPAQRIGPGATILNQLVIQITQQRRHLAAAGRAIRFRGGCTFIIDLGQGRVRYAIAKSILDETRLARQVDYVLNGPPDLTLHETYAGELNAAIEPFALLHRDL